MKLGMKLTNPVALIAQLYANGAAAVVLFNHMYQPDIDVEKMEHRAERYSSSRRVISLVALEVGIASSQVDKIDYAVSRRGTSTRGCGESDIERSSCRGGVQFPFI